MTFNVKAILINRIDMNTWKHKRASKLLCGKMVGIRSVGVGVDEHQSEDSFVCFGARDFLRDWKKIKKSKVPEQSTDRS